MCLISTGWHVWHVTISPGPDDCKKFIVDADLNPAIRWLWGVSLCQGWHNGDVLMSSDNGDTPQECGRYLSPIWPSLASCQFVPGALSCLWRAARLITWQQSIIFLIKCYTFSQADNNRSNVRLSGPHGRVKRLVAHIIGFPRGLLKTVVCCSILFDPGVTCWVVRVTSDDSDSRDHEMSSRCLRSQGIHFARWLLCLIYETHSR